MRRIGKLFGVGGLAFVLFVAGGIGFGTVIRSDPPPSVRGVDPSLAVRPAIGTGPLVEIMTSLQARLRAVPQDWHAAASLGLAYVQQARIVADPRYYPKAEDVLRRSLEAHPEGNVDAMIAMAALAAARHDFAGALSWAERAEAENPQNANIHAVTGDALVELGRYEEAFDAFQQAVDLRPDVATYARASYAWELQGNLGAATDIMQLANSAAGTAADRAWTSYQLGELAWTQGQLQKAEALYARARQLDPEFVPPQAGLARVALAQARTDDAIRLYRRVVERLPVPEHVAAFGDLLASVGRADDADQQYALVEAEAALFRANGANVDLEIALFDADHGRGAEAVQTARAEWARRHSIHVADALGWALHAQGHDPEALAYANLALRLGTENSLFLFHRGVIEQALGRDTAARRDLAAALDLNPHFSILWSGTAVALLKSLGGAP